MGKCNSRVDTGKSGSQQKCTQFGKKNMFHMHIINAWLSACYADYLYMCLLSVL